jgi:cytochrome d ubiquinol oxidase subunit I
MRTDEAISTVVPAGQILFSILLFSAIYALLFGIWIFLIRHQLNKGPDEAMAGAAGEVS